MRIIDLTDVTDEDRLKSDIYFTEQIQQQQLQQQLYFNGSLIQTAPVMPSTQLINTQPIMSTNMVSINQLDAPFWSQQNTASPRLKPIGIADKYLTAAAGANSNPSSMSNNGGKKNVITAKQQNFPTRFNRL